MVGNPVFAIEVKSTSDIGEFEGVLSTYGNIDQVGDVCEKGCFDDDLSKEGARRVFLWQHDYSQPIGSFEAVSDDVALRVKGRFNMEVSKAREAYALLKSGDISGLSIGYLAEDYSYDKDGIRHLYKVKLLEGSLVTFPANVLATASAKSMERKARIMRYAQMKSLEDLDEETRTKILDELAEMDGDKAEDDSAETPEKEEEKPEDDQPKAGDDVDEEKSEDDQIEDETKVDIEDLKRKLKEILEQIP